MFWLLFLFFPQIGAVLVMPLQNAPDEMLTDPEKFIFGKNLITGEKFVQDLTVIDEPTPVRRVRLLFSTSQAVSSNQVIDVFHMKLRWIEPDFWNDNFTETGRVYKILCEVEDENTGHTRTFLALTVDAVFNGYDEKYVFPKMPLVARCQVKAKNGADLESDWSSSSPVQLYQLFAEQPEITEPLPDPPLKHHHRNQFWTRFRTA